MDKGNKVTDVSFKVRGDKCEVKPNASGTRPRKPQHCISPQHHLTVLYTRFLVALPRVMTCDETRPDLERNAPAKYNVVLPYPTQDLYFGPKETHPIRSHAAPELVCWNGHSLASVGALTLAVRDHLSQEGTRRWFQTSGVVYGTAAAMAATNAFRVR